MWNDANKYAASSTKFHLAPDLLSVKARGLLIGTISLVNESFLASHCYGQNQHVYSLVMSNCW